MWIYYFDDYVIISKENAKHSKGIPFNSFF
jgi:hypothetical protein